MLTAFVRAFQTPDLRKKMLITLGLIALFRFGASIPTPGIDEKNVTLCSNLATSAGSPTAGVLGIVNLLSARPCCTCRCSRSASCRTSPPASSCSCSRS